MKFNISIIVLISAFLLLTCQQSEKALQISPKFLPGASLFLGEKWNEVVQKRKIKNYRDIVTIHSEYGASPYFDGGVEYNFTFWTKRLVKVVFSKHFEGRPNDSIAREIINICRKEYGDDFKIYAMPEDTTYQDKHPVLVWEKEGGFIEISYIPEIVYDNEKRKNKFPDAYINLVISKDLETYLPAHVSTEFTRKSLGIR